MRSEIYTDTDWKLFLNQSSRSVLVLLCMWYLDYRHNTDTEPDGEFMKFITQIQMNILILWELTPDLLLMQQ